MANETITLALDTGLDTCDGRSIDAPTQTANETGDTNTLAPSPTDDQTDSDPPREPASFATLPGELKNVIFELHFSDFLCELEYADLSNEHEEWNLTHGWINILLANRQINKEAASYFWPEARLLLNGAVLTKLESVRGLVWSLNKYCAAADLERMVFCLKFGGAASKSIEKYVADVKAIVRLLDHHKCLDERGGRMLFNDVVESLPRLASRDLDMSELDEALPAKKSKGRELPMNTEFRFWIVVGDDMFEEREELKFKIKFCPWKETFDLAGPLHKLNWDKEI